MIRLAFALALLATPASAEICFEVGHQPVKRISSAPRPVSVVRVMRIRVGPPRTVAADVTFACPVEEPVETYMTVVYGPEMPALPGDLASPPDHIGDANELMPRPPQLHADRSLYLGPVRPLQPPSAIPEPSTWLSLLIGFSGLGAALRILRKLA